MGDRKQPTPVPTNQRRPDPPPAPPRNQTSHYERWKSSEPAFPTDKTHDIRAGMTLRDYFAAKAMQGLISSNDEGAGDRIEEIPRYAYMIADAMLKAREKG